MKPKYRSNPAFHAPIKIRSRRNSTAGLGIAICAAGLSFLPSLAHADSASWSNTAGGTRSWNAIASWTPNTTFPNGVGEIANMSATNITGGSAANIVNLNAPITIGQLLLGDSNNTAFYSIRTGTAGGALIFDNTDSTNAVLIDTATAGANTTPNQTPDNISANITLNDSLDITTNSTATGNIFTITGIISEGSAGKSITKYGLGPLWLMGVNTYTGTTTIESGMLKATGAASLGAATSAIQLGTANTISSNLSATLRLNGAVSLTRDIIVGASNASTTGTYTIDSDNGATAVNISGNIILNQNVTLYGFTSTGFNISGNITSGSSGTQVATFGGGSNYVAVTGVIGGGTGTLDVVKAGGGALRLSGTNTYTGNTTISAGPFNVQDAGSLGSGNYAGNIANAGSFNYSSSVNQTLSGAITGTGSVTKTGAATLTLSGANAYTGNTTVNGGTMILSGSNASASNTTITSGILSVRSDNALGSAGVVTQVNRLGGIQLQGGISIPGTVSFVTSNDGMNAGAIGYAIDNASGDNTINGTIKMTTGGGGTIIQSTAGTLTLAGNINSDSTRSLILQGASTGANTVSGVISNGAAGTAGLTKTGTGNWYLTGANTYTGATVVSAGTLFVNGSLGNTAVAVDGGTLAGTGVIGGSVTVGSATYSPGASPGSMEIAGSLTLGINTTTNIELGGTAFTLNGTEQYDRTKLTGTNPTLTLAGTLAISLFGGFTPDEGQAFGIFQLESGATLAGTFAGLNEGALVGNFGGEDLYITYQGDFGDSGPVATSGGNDIVLYSVPEPSAAVLGLLSTLMLLRRRNR